MIVTKKTVFIANTEQKITKVYFCGLLIYKSTYDKLFNSNPRSHHQSHH